MLMSSQLFDEETVKALQGIFQSFKKPVKDYLVVDTLDDPRDEEEDEHHHHTHYHLHVAGEGCHTCSEAKMLAMELAKISNGQLSFDIVERGKAGALRPRYVPAFIYGSSGLNIRYYGLPSGEEFAPFIYVHQYISLSEVKLSSKVKEVIESIETPLHVKVFVTPECPYCPIVVDYFNQMALLNKNIMMETIEAIELPIEADAYGIQAVPYVTINRIEDYDNYGAEPVEVIPGYVPPDHAVKVLVKAERKIKRGGGSGKTST
jgi:alkyl hydroperoxide reductase subunit AhpF